jgi:hypothetical protein
VVADISFALLQMVEVEEEFSRRKFSKIAQEKENLMLRITNGKVVRNSVDGELKTFITNIKPTTTTISS